MIPSLMLFVAGIALTSCNDNKTTGEKLGATANVKPELTEQQPVLYRGALYLGDEAQYMVACGFNQDEWWINYDAIGDEFINQYEDITEKPIEIYAEVKGYLDTAPDAKDEFASDYDGVLNITEIIVLNDLDDGNDCTKEDKIN